MKILLTICSLLLTGAVLSQNKSTDILIASKSQRLQDITDPATLSRLLTAPYSTEKDKVRAIFVWIAENISYYRGVTKNTKKRSRIPVYEEDQLIDTGSLKPLTERVAIKVLQDKRTYCDGYSRLFKSLCDHADINSEIVTGYARSDMNRAEEKFRSNHAWNVVLIDSVWQLLDVTWASGYINYADQFVKRFDEYYFLTAPEKFIVHHYPDDLRWTLLDRPPALYEFRYTPFRQRSYVKYEITDYYPSRGIIEANLGDTIRLELETNNAYRNLSIAPDSLWDSTSLVRSPFYSYLQPQYTVKGDKVLYTFTVESETTEWLHLMYNNDAVLRYKLNVKQIPSKQSTTKHRVDLQPELEQKPLQ